MDVMFSKDVDHAGTEVPNETKDLLLCIVNELRNIGSQLERQERRLNLLGDGKQVESTDIELEHQRNGERPATPSLRVWVPVLAEIRNAWPASFTLDDVNQTYERDLIGSTLAKYDDNYYIPSAQPTIQEQETWSFLIGDLWRVPVDGRLPLRFQRYWLSHPDGVVLPGSERLSAHSYLEQFLAAGCNVLVTDYFDNGKKVQYSQDKHWFTTPPRHGREASNKAVNCPAGLWRRVLRLHGLEFNTVSLVRGSPGHRSGAKIIEDYRLCRRVSGVLPSWIRFHVTFYEIKRSPTLFDGQKYSQKTVGTSSWRQGVLHSDRREYWARQHLASGSGPRKLCESAYTIAALSSYYEGLEYPRDYWTLMELRPDGFPPSYDSFAIPSGYKCDVLEIVLNFADKALPTILARWVEILEYFDHIISEKNAFLDPERHDSLLSDDETFSRSKKYFWAITTLKELDDSISDNLLQIAQLSAHRASDEAEVARKSNLENAREAMTKHYHEFENVAKELREKRREARDLRDGLFSASAVMESRAATRLGENVKLLTLVSIFFLPLSFCMSVWSVNTLFSINSLAITATIVGLSTYIIVFNINHIVDLSQNIYAAFVRSTVDSMKDDKEMAWVERARIFEKFIGTRVGESRPSAWLLFQYTLRRMFWRSKRSKTSGKNTILPNVASERSAQPSDRSLWGRRKRNTTSRKYQMSQQI